MLQARSRPARVASSTWSKRLMDTQTNGCRLMVPQSSHMGLRIWLVWAGMVEEQSQWDLNVTVKGRLACVHHIEENVEVPPQ